MAHIFVKNSLSNLKAAKVNVNLPMYVSTNSKGDPIWLLEVATTYPSASGTRIRPAYVNKTVSFEELDGALSDAVSEIASQIDWLPLVADNTPPYVESYKPQGNNVSIASNLDIEIREDIPTAGIDLSEIQVILNNGDIDIDITNDCNVNGTPLNYNIRWEPPQRVFKRYEEEQ